MSQPAPIAYFCAEFGLESQLPWYAGGLGVLAGDVLRAAVQTRTPMVAIGLFYHGWQFSQQITPDGWQVEANREFSTAEYNIEPVLVDGKELTLSVPIGPDTLKFAVMQKRLSAEVILYVLELDREWNPPQHRFLLHSLYSGDEYAQLCQHILLGCGGMKVLEALNIQPRVYHMNEGRPAFMIWELARQIQSETGQSGWAALSSARQKIVYTNHTLERAGNMLYDQELVRQFAKPFARMMNLEPDDLLLTSQENGSILPFSLTDFALAASCCANGVSELHTELAKYEWPNHDWVNVTNGVSLPLWQEPAWHEPEKKTNRELWQVHRAAKRRLETVAWRRTGYHYDSERLVVGWARRITAYKQLDGVFSDIEHLKAVLSRATHPVQIIVAGKAHPGDTAAKKMLQEVIHLFQTELSGSAMFIPDYDLALAQYMIQGCDVWLNTPEPGREACGTSGMKALSNGVLACTTEDGWVAETDWQDTGWIIDARHVGTSWVDLLENEILPLFNNREEDVPVQWVERMRRSVKLAEHFSAERMLLEYEEKLYGRVSGSIPAIGHSELGSEFVGAALQGLLPTAASDGLRM